MALPLALRVAAPAARPHVPRLAAAGVLALVRAGVLLAEPWPLAVAVDHAIDRRPFTGALAMLNGLAPILLLALLAATLVLLNAVIGLLEVAGTLCGERAAERIGARLRQDLFDQSMSLSLRWHDRMRSGELVARLTSDVGRILDGVIAVTTTVLPDTVMVVTVLAVLATFSPALALVGLAVVPVLAVLAIRQRRQVREVQSEARYESGRLAAVTSDLFRNVRAVQAFGRIGRASTIFSTRNRELLRADLDTVGVEARWTPMADLVLAGGAGLVLVVGGSQVLGGGLTVGSLLVVLAYLEDLYAPVRGLAKLAGSLAKAGASAVRVHEVLTATEAVVDIPNARPAPLFIRDLRFENVGFAYESGLPVIQDFNLTVASGETVCLFGPSGAGKSTVLHLLLRLYDVDTGRILVGGLDIRGLDRFSLRRRMAFVPQDPWLLDATIAENIAFGSRQATRAEVRQAGHDALVDEFATTLPHGYDTPVGEGGVRLSGGQRRRVALARAAVSRSPILLLDEPTAGLDADSADSVMQAVRASTIDHTVLLITHDRDLAAIADRVVPIRYQPNPLLTTAAPIVPAQSRP
ncbi:MAG TPA: ABC transporter ATP-binding protein [Pseudonocardiaceae bacterium]|jgi:ATP-binding cassette subfamily B protein|nr:ABC transporter ATP-binding protein [Pseudonocardiaceae bacterium]